MFFKRLNEKLKKLNAENERLKSQIAILTENGINLSAKIEKLETNYNRISDKLNKLIKLQGNGEGKKNENEKPTLSSVIDDYLKSDI